MSLGNLIYNASDVLINNKEENTNEVPHTSLKDFLAKFSDDSQKQVNKLNPLNTFEVSIKFHPTIVDTLMRPDGSSTEDNSTWLQRLSNKLLNSAKNEASNILTNLTGGLVGSLLSLFTPEVDKQYADSSVMDEHNSYKDVGKHSFMHYLAKANLLVGSEPEWFGTNCQSLSPLELQLGYYVQSITLPQIKIPDGGKITTLIGEFPLNGQYVIPENNQIQLEILTTKLPLIERIFYPWMKEVTMPFWCYSTQPYTTATITIDFSKHTDLQYVFYGCRPQSIYLMQPNQENNQGSFKRQVTLIFDTMIIQSGLSIRDQVKKVQPSMFDNASKLMEATSTTITNGIDIANRLI